MYIRSIAPFDTVKARLFNSICYPLRALQNGVLVTDVVIGSYNGESWHKNIE